MCHRQQRSGVAGEQHERVHREPRDEAGQPLVRLVERGSSMSWATVTCGWYGNSSSRSSGPLRIAPRAARSRDTPRATWMNTTGEVGRNVPGAGQVHRERLGRARPTSARCSSTSAMSRRPTGVGGSRVTCGKTDRPPGRRPAAATSVSTVACGCGIAIATPTRRSALTVVGRASRRPRRGRNPTRSYTSATVAGDRRGPARRRGARMRSSLGRVGQQLARALGERLGERDDGVGRRQPSARRSPARRTRPRPAPAVRSVTAPRIASRFDTPGLAAGS